MNNTPSAIIFLILTLIYLHVCAHGEGKPGPHGGFIRMPGPFHTEVVKESGGYRVFLLDIDWKNPSVLASSVSAFIESDRTKTNLICTKKSDSYFCKSFHPQKGILHINAKRNGQSGTIASYKLPLKFEIPQNEMPDHKGH